MAISRTQFVELLTEHRRRNWNRIQILTCLSRPQVLAEAKRALKPGGAMHVACADDLHFCEPHYKVWFVPLLAKFLGYLRI